MYSYATISTARRPLRCGGDRTDEHATTHHVEPTVIQKGHRLMAFTRWTRWTRSLGLCLTMLLVVTMLAACGGDDADDDATPPAGTGSSSGTVAADSGTDATATTADETAENTATTSTGSAPAATSDPSGSVATSATTEATPAVSEPTTGTGTDTNVTPTTSADVPDECDTAAEDIETLDPDLIPNFSIRFEVISGGDSEESGALGTVSMTMEQSEPGTYHSSIEVEGTSLQSWVIGDQAWSDFGVGVMETEPGTDLFGPDVLLSQMTDGLKSFYKANEEGSEEVNGRDTTLYVIDGEDYADAYNRCAGEAQTIEDASGELRYWIDDEWGVMVKGEGNMEWTYSDDTTTTFEFNQEMFDIGDTAAIEPPA